MKKKKKERKRRRKIGFSWTAWRTVDLFYSFFSIVSLLIELSYRIRVSAPRRNYIRDSGTRLPQKRPKDPNFVVRLSVYRVSDGNLKIAPGHTSVAGAALLLARNGILRGSTRRLFLCRVQPRVLCLPRVKILTSLTRLSRRLSTPPFFPSLSDTYP